MAREATATRVCGASRPPRTKGNREHRVPLCRRALEILEVARALSRRSPLLFPSRGGKPIATTMLSELLRELKIAAVLHGFRLRFRDGGGRRNRSSSRGEELPGRNLRGAFHKLAQHGGQDEAGADPQNAAQPGDAVPRHLVISIQLIATLQSHPLVRLSARDPTLPHPSTANPGV